MAEFFTPFDCLMQLPTWAVMWTLAASVFAVCKWVTWRVVAGELSAVSSCAYLFGWPGLDGAAFTRLVPRSVPTVAPKEWGAAIGKALFGAALIWCGVGMVPDSHPLLAGWVGMVGLIFLLHFGAFHLLALLWRSVGYDVRPIMQAPYRSTSLMEFWSQRWNLAFRDLSHRLILRPLRPRLGAMGAMLVVFLVSGLVHDLVISIPAGGGYGLPTMYFLIQAVGIGLQRSAWGRRWSLNRGVVGWVVTAACLMVPLPMLFHEPFVSRVILPFLAAIGTR